MKIYEGLTLTPSLLEGAQDQAVKVLTEYFTRRTGTGDPWYTGGVFDGWDPSGTRSRSMDTFTADDLVAVTLLAVEFPGQAAVSILDTHRKRFNDLLRDVGDDRDLVDEPSVEEAAFPAWPLWRALMSLPGMGPTTTSKLIARKRPRLVPVYDRVIRTHVFNDSGLQWLPLWTALRADSGALHQRLVELRTVAVLPHHISPLRVFDVLAWMDGSGRTAELRSS
ncbi:DUF6308 family protein [Allobranchiibius sp. CTAmp26]|uniref:DUF6308 family protein n=1 Tax=Allobranchiibius sp. CTAmp26 TaxID=2815214 RepID=UPI001AA16830|nr:DUF6308 family protein [Allobranchiibius sp. CTAmp26]MBO1756456.1 hypothetical protein [Allobranchiibius sp. CTAmp26]